MVTPLDQRPRSAPSSGMTARSSKRFLTQAFIEADLPFAEEDALEIVLSATGFDKTRLMLRGAETLDPEIIEIIKNHMERRLSGEPVDHILGWREFYGRRFHVSKHVLSPRADTETLIRGALLRLNKTSTPRLLDLGTGSGAIGLTLLAEKDAADLMATDISAAALEVAKKNAEALQLRNRVTFFQGSWWEAVPDDAVFDMVVSNPPYITDAAMQTLEVEVTEYDPDLALRGGPEGLKAYRDILARANFHLVTGGWLGFEIGFDQGGALQNLLENESWTAVSLETDMGGNDRVIWAQKIR